MPIINDKCYFYSDNKCRREDKDCLKHLAEEYTSLYKLNYENQCKAEQQLKRLEKENERLKQGIKHYQRGVYKIISIATECKNSKQWNYEDK